MENKTTVTLDNYYNLASRTENCPTGPVKLTRDEVAVTEQVFRMAIMVGDLVDKLKRYLVYKDSDQSLIEMAELSGLFRWMAANKKDMDFYSSRELSVREFRLLHAAMGKFTEAGELMQAVSDQQAQDEVNILEEVGDSLWYDAIFASLCGFKFQEALQKNINKLRARYPNKFTEADAVNRDLEAERKVLEAQPL